MWRISLTSDGEGEALNHFAQLFQKKVHYLNLRLRWTGDAYTLVWFSLLCVCVCVFFKDMIGWISSSMDKSRMCVSFVGNMAEIGYACVTKGRLCGMRTLKFFFIEVNYVFPTVFNRILFFPSSFAYNSSAFREYSFTRNRVNMFVVKPVGQRSVAHVPLHLYCSISTSIASPSGIPAISAQRFPKVNVWKTNVTFIINTERL